MFSHISSLLVPYNHRNTAPSSYTTQKTLMFSTAPKQPAVLREISADFEQTVRQVQSRKTLLICVANRLCTSSFQMSEVVICTGQKSASKSKHLFSITVIKKKKVSDLKEVQVQFPYQRVQQIIQKIRNRNTNNLNVHEAKALSFPGYLIHYSNTLAIKKYRRFNTVHISSGSNIQKTNTHRVHIHVYRNLIRTDAQEQNLINMIILVFVWD